MYCANAIWPQCCTHVKLKVLTIGFAIRMRTFAVLFEIIHASSTKAQGLKRSMLASFVSVECSTWEPLRSKHDRHHRICWQHFPLCFDSSRNPCPPMARQISWTKQSSPCIKQTTFEDITQTTSRSPRHLLCSSSQLIWDLTYRPLRSWYLQLRWCWSAMHSESRPEESELLKHHKTIACPLCILQGAAQGTWEW